MILTVRYKRMVNLEITPEKYPIEVGIDIKSIDVEMSADEDGPLYDFTIVMEGDRDLLIKVLQDATNLKNNER